MGKSRSKLSFFYLLFFTLVCVQKTFAEGEAEAVAPTTEKPDRPSAFAAMQKRDAKSISSYKPIYLAYGEPLTKIQFSFRSQLSDELPINFAYTQVIFWELARESKPFLDATYNPEFFYRWEPNGNDWSNVDFGVWEHNSNGKANSESRSYDQSYVRGALTKEWSRIAAVFGIKLKYIYNNEESNHDIQSYMGPVDYDLVLLRLLEDSFLDQAELILTLRPGGKYGEDLDKGGYQIAWNFHIKGIKVNPAFYIQYYHGYAETLINYNTKVDSYRFGIMF